MKVNGLTKRALHTRRETRDMLAAGWERVGAGGGRLWELDGGCRIGWIITDVRIAADGLSLWIKTRDARQAVNHPLREQMSDAGQ